MSSPARITMIALLYSCLGLLTACSDDNDNDRGSGSTQYLPISLAGVESPPDVGAPNLLSTNFDLATVGYEQREYFLAGSAASFSNTNELDEDGRWEAEPGALADYRIRVLVYRPLAETDYSGTVFVEWLNVTAGFETPPSWGSGHTEILRAGHAWVGVSAQYVGIEGSPRALLPLHLKAVNPQRYGSLLHPGDSFSYDIFSQVAQALRQTGGSDLLRGLAPRRLIAMGQSQSAGRLATYINAIHPLYHAYDGYMVHSRGAGSSPLSQAPEVAIPTPEVVKLRTDLDVPVFSFQTETDVIAAGGVNARQEDSSRFRLWEVPGAAHGDYYSFVSGRDDTGVDPKYAVVVENNSVLGYITCERPINSGPLTWVFNAALSSLHHWVLNGALPARAHRIALSDDNTAFTRDELGNVKGGVRTPYVDEPAAVLSGEPNSGASFCFLFGTTALFDAATMASRYVDKANYIKVVSAATDKAVAKGFVLAADGERIKAAAALQWDRAMD